MIVTEISAELAEPVAVLPINLKSIKVLYDSVIGKSILIGLAVVGEDVITGYLLLEAP